MLKNVLSLLLSKFYSKKESSLVARQGIPDYSSAPTTLALTSTNKVFKATAPFDCFFIGRADMALTSNVEGVIGLRVSGVQVNFVNKIFGNSVYEEKSGYARKGEEIQVVLDPWGNTSTRNYKILCYKLVGGGYQALKKLLLQGGGLCLKVWYSSLRRSFLSVRRHGSATSLKLSYLAARIFPIPPALTNKITQLQVMELYALMSRVQNGLSCALRQIILGEFCNTLLSKKTLLSKLFSLSQRARLSLSMSRLKEPPLVSSSFRPLVLNEVKGGASC